MKLLTLLTCATAVSALPLNLQTAIFDKLFPQSPELVSQSSEQLSLWDTNKPLIDLHKGIVEFSSVSGDEHDVSVFLKEYFESKDFTVETFVLDEETGRQNLFVYPGSTRETRLLLTSHIDTVPPFFPYSVQGDDIYGRGTVDDKASVATQIIAFEELLSDGAIKEGDVALLLTVGEESGFAGALFANETLHIDWETVIFGEPTNFTLITGHKGSAGGLLKATGKTGHSSIPELGINAIDLLIDALEDLRAADFPGSDVLGRSTLNIGVIEGGVAANVIPGEATATLLLRVATENTTAIDEVFDSVLVKHERVEFVKYSSHGPVLFDQDIPGYELAIMPGGTDAAALTGNFKKYLIGPGSFASIHAANEHISVGELARGVEVYKDVVLYKLGKK